MPRIPDAGQCMFFPFRYRFISTWSYVSPCRIKPNCIYLLNCWMSGWQCTKYASIITLHIKFPLTTISPSWGRLFAGNRFFSSLLWYTEPSCRRTRLFVSRPKGTWLRFTFCVATPIPHTPAHGHHLAYMLQSQKYSLHLEIFGHLACANAYFQVNRYFWWIMIE